MRCISPDLQFVSTHILLIKSRSVLASGGLRGVSADFEGRLLPLEAQGPRGPRPICLPKSPELFDN